MALQFTFASTDRVDIATSVSDWTTGSTLMWFFANSFGAGGVLGWSINDPAAGDDSVRFFQIFNTGGDVNCLVQASSTLQRITDDTPMSTGKWTCLAASWAIGTGLDLYIGDLTTPLAQLSSFLVDTDGSGTNDTGGDDISIGNKGSASAGADADIAFAGIWTGTQTLGELTAQQWRPHVTANCEVFMHLGFVPAASTQPNWSGTGNNGTPTGLVLADHVPLGPPFGFDEPSVTLAAAPPTGRAKFLPLLGVA